MTRRSAPWLAVALAVAAAAAGAAVDESALEACRAERDDARRLACYDRVIDGTTVEAPPVPAKPEDRFGREKSIAYEERQRARRVTESIGELNALVAEIQTRSDGLMTISLDNGQVWRQNRPDSQFRLKVGDTVRIQPGVLNSFLMSGPTKRSTRVSRVK
jgi:hypothetical protein